MSVVVESNATSLQPEQRYALEAAKRKRKEGVSQFEPILFSEDERIRTLGEDPFADHAALDRLPMPIEDGGRVKFFILGAGLGGILAAIKLVQKGFTSDQIVFIDQAGGVGGTWYFNRYPGLHCDIESYVYLPLLEETGYIPKQKYSSSVEIRQYAELLVQRFGLENRILFRTKITGLVWDDTSKMWNIGLEKGHGPKGKEQHRLSVHAEFAILGAGIFVHPQVPKALGLSDFQGPMFHTSRWDYNATGGSSEDAFPSMHKLSGARVGIIGTGATAVQAIPELAKYAKEVFVFQRTPSNVHPRGQRVTDADEWKNKIATKPGWQRKRRNNLAHFMQGENQDGDENLVDDEWTRLNTYSAFVGTRRFGKITPDKAEEHIANLLALDSETSKRSREHISKLVKDKKTAEKLTAWYPTWCKRPTYSDTYLQAFNEDHVHLVETDGKGIKRVTSNGVVANGQEYPVDILVLATGFRSPLADGNPGSRVRINILGRDGRKMTDKWQQQGISTLHGMMTNGFPNLFFMDVPQAAASPNYMHVLDTLTEHIGSIIAHAHQRTSTKSQAATIEATATAEEAWGMEIAQSAAFFCGGLVCTPSYLNMEGEANRLPPSDDPVAALKVAKGAIWSSGVLDFTKTLEDWRSDGMDGVEVQIVG